MPTMLTGALRETTCFSIFLGLEYVFTSWGTCGAYGLASYAYTLCPYGGVGWAGV